MTDLEWQEGIERALNAAWEPDAGYGMKTLASELAKALPVRIALCHTGQDKLGHFRVGPARDEEA